MKLVSVGHPGHGLNAVLGHESLHSTHHPLHDERHVDKVLVRDSLGVVSIQR